MKKVLLVVGLVVLFFAQSVYAKKEFRKGNTFFILDDRKNEARSKWDLIEVNNIDKPNSLRMAYIYIRKPYDDCVDLDSKDYLNTNFCERINISVGMTSGKTSRVRKDLDVLASITCPNGKIVLNKKLKKAKLGFIESMTEGHIFCKDAKKRKKENDIKLAKEAKEREKEFANLNPNEFKLVCDDTYMYNPITNDGVNMEDHTQTYIFNTKKKEIKFYGKNEVTWRYNDYKYEDKKITIKNIKSGASLVNVHFDFRKNDVLFELRGGDDVRINMLSKCDKAQELASLIEGDSNDPSFSNEELNTIVQASSGTGFFVSTNGHMVTNNHVIDSCDMVKAHYKGRELDANVLFTDRSNDLAIIKANIKPEKVFPVSNEDVSLLEDIIVAGYPLGKNISASIKTFKGSVTALAGFGDNYSNFQIDASLSSGNSGGPIINQKGNVVGVAVEKLVEVGVEGFNFGVKSSTLKTFASSNQIKFQDPSTEELSNKELGQLITEATIYLECWMSVAKIKQIIEEGERQKAFFSEYK